MSPLMTCVHGTLMLDGFASQLRETCDRLMPARGAGVPAVELAFSIEGACPVPMRGAVLLAVEELVRNAKRTRLAGFSAKRSACRCRACGAEARK